MMIYQSPTKYVQQEGLLQQLDEYMIQLGKKALLVAHATDLVRVQSSLNPVIKRGVVELVPSGFLWECTDQEVSSPYFLTVIAKAPVRSVDLPTSFSVLSVQHIDRDRLIAAARESCREDQSMRNMPLPITQEDVVKALIEADRVVSLETF